MSLNLNIKMKALLDTIIIIHREASKEPRAASRLPVLLCEPWTLNPETSNFDFHLPAFLFHTAVTYFPAVTYPLFLPIAPCIHIPPFHLDSPAFTYPLSSFPQRGKASSNGCCCSICYIKHWSSYSFPIISRILLLLHPWGKVGKGVNN